MRYPIFLVILTIFNLSETQSQAYTIENYQIDIDVNQDATFDVHEIISVAFNEKRRGIFRNVPRSFKINGKVVKTKLTDVEVKGHKFKILKEGNDYVIRIGDKNKYLNGTQTYDFTYSVENAILFEEDHTAFQYNLISDWDTDIAKMEYNINLPVNLELAENEFRIATGKEGSGNNDATISKTGRRIHGNSLTPIPAKENVTVAIKLPVDYLTRPVPPPPPVPILQRDKFWLAPLAFLGFLFTFFFKQRKTDLSHITTPQYYPPDNFSPAEVGAYHDHKVNTEDIISLLPYWAHKGFLKISSGPEGNLFFKKLSSLPVESSEYENIVFTAIFQDDDMVMLSELKEKMYRSMHSASSQIKKTLLGKSMYDESSYKSFHSGTMILLGAIGIALGAFLLAKFSLLLTGIICILAGIGAFSLHFLEPKKSEKGEILKLQLEHLKSFLKNGNSDKTGQLLRENPSYFEEVFPYAIALGVDKEWIHRMKDFEIDEPHWYGYEGQSPNNRRQDMTSFSKNFDVKEIKSVFTSAPPPKSNSGGGGFSGGAGGGFGGGGGSW